MAGVLKLSDGGGCCDCAQVSGCNCGESNCALECETRQAVALAELCGYAEFTTPSDPPKTYKIKTIGGAINLCQYPDDSCAIEDCAEGYPSTYIIEGGGTNLNGAGLPRNYTWAATFIPESWTGTQWRYRLASCSAVRQNESPIPPTVLTGVVANITQGNTTDIDPCDGVGVGGAPGDIFISANDAGPVVFTASVRQFQAPPAAAVDFAGTRDEWDIVCDYNADLGNCVPATTDDSIRYELYPGVCGSGGTATGTPSSICTPGPDTYGSASLAAGTTTPTERTWDGVGCAAIGGGLYQGVTGSITEELSDEDTEEDAMARLFSGPEDGWGESGCLEFPAFKSARGEGEFTFSFREQRVRARMTTEIGRTYRLTIGFYRRLIGAAPADPWILAEVEEIEFTADETEEVTDWVPVPNAAGYNTRPQTCLLEDITPP